MLDYKLLEAFAEVLSSSGFEKAAARLHLTQSAVSQRVKQLEEQYGQILLRRTSPPEPTEAGSVLLAHYHQVKQLENDLVIRKKDEQKTWSSLSIAVNEDSLATWFYPAVRALLPEQSITLDIHVDDQDNTHELLQRGAVLACVSSRETPFQGCRATRLGTMRYHTCATREFAVKWFADGFSRQACEQAPMALFNRKDKLNETLFTRLFGVVPANPPTFFLPSPEKYADFIGGHHCYGIIPSIQFRQLADTIDLVDLCPDHHIEVTLYYHCWTLKSAAADTFEKHVIREATRLLSR